MQLVSTQLDLRELELVLQVPVDLCDQIVKFCDLEKYLCVEKCCIKLAEGEEQEEEEEEEEEATLVLEVLKKPGQSNRDVTQTFQLKSFFPANDDIFVLITRFELPTSSKNEEN